MRIRRKPNLDAGSAHSSQTLPCDPGDWDLESGHSRCVRDYFFARTCRAVNTRSCVPLQCLYSGFLVRQLHGIRVDMAWVSHHQQSDLRSSGQSFTPWKRFAQTKDKEWQRTPYFIHLFVLCIIIVFLVDIGSNNWNCEPWEARILIQMGEHRTQRISENNEWYRLLSSSFLHFDWRHLFGNIAGLYWNGVFFEQRHGMRKVFFLSVVGSIGAALFCSILKPDRVSVGASDVCYALLGMSLADIWTNWDMLIMKKSEDDKAIFLFCTLLNLSSEFWAVIVMPANAYRVNHISHMGGLLSGFFFALPFCDHMKSCWGIFGDIPHCYRRRLVAARYVCFTTATFGAMLSILFLWRSKVTPDIP